MNRGFSREGAGLTAAGSRDFPLTVAAFRRVQGEPDELLRGEAVGGSQGGAIRPGTGDLQPHLGTNDHPDRASDPLGKLDRIEAAELPQPAQTSPVDVHREPSSPTHLQIARNAEIPQPER